MTVVANDHTRNDDDWPLPHLVKHYRESKVVVLFVIMGTVVAVLLLVLHLHARAARAQ